MIHKSDIQLRCEDLVVGSGAGGALTSSYLAEKGKDVLVLEEGPCCRLRGEDTSIAKAFSTLWREGGVIPIWGNAKLVFAEGRCVGGSTTINSGIIHRLPKEIASEWANDFSIADFDYPVLEKCFNSVLEKLKAKVIPDEYNIASILFKKGAAKCGFNGADVPVAATVLDGHLKKNSMLDTFLKTGLQHGMKIMSGCKADKITIKSNRAVEIKALITDNQGRTQRVGIRCDNVFLCAGTIQTSLLLRRSGITDNIGNSIGFHPTLRVLAEFDDAVNAYAQAMPSFQIKEFSPAISIGASASLPPFIASGLSYNWDHNKQYLKHMKNMAIFYVVIRSDAKGISRNISLINSYGVRYNLLPQDLRNLSFGYERLCELLLSAGARRLFPSIDGLMPVTALKSLDASLDSISPAKLKLISIHSFSSCPMGENKNKCAADSFGKLHGFQNIFINDASLLPRSPSVNPQGPLMTVALRNMEKNFGG